MAEQYCVGVRAGSLGEPLAVSEASSVNFWPCIAAYIRADGPQSLESKLVSAPNSEDCSGVHLWLVLMKAHAALLEHARSSIQSSGLGDSDFFVLEVLLHKGPLAVNTIGQKVRLTSGSMSVAIDRLVKRGFVERSGHPQDRRVRVVQLTPAGRELIESAFDKHAAAMESAATGLSDSERLTLVRLLKKLGKAAEAGVHVNGH